MLAGAVNSDHVLAKRCRVASLEEAEPRLKRCRKFINAANIVLHALLTNENVVFFALSVYAASLVPADTRRIQ
jgi:hypothetical protein